jgi:hypothetical protein
MSKYPKSLEDEDMKGISLSKMFGVMRTKVVFMSSWKNGWSKACNGLYLMGCFERS